MQRNKILILFIVFTQAALAQEMTIDQISGFGSFNFHDPYSDYKRNLRLTLIISFEGEQKFYDYTGNELKKVHDFKTTRVSLGFENDSLFYIDIYFQGLNENEYNELLKAFETEFGTATIMDNPADKGVERGYQWEGEEISAQLILYNDNAIDEYDRNKILFILRVK